MNNYLFLDLGTKTGYCICLDNNLSDLKHGNKIFRRKNNVDNKFECDFDAFEAFLIDTVKEYNINAIGYEKVMKHNGTYAAHCYGSLQTVVKKVVHNYKLALLFRYPSQIKKLFANHGHAPKEEIVKECLRRGIKVSNFDEADAIALCYAVIEEII